MRHSRTVVAVLVQQASGYLEPVRKNEILACLFLSFEVTVKVWLLSLMIHKGFVKSHVLIIPFSIYLIFIHSCYCSPHLQAEGDGRCQEFKIKKCISVDLKSVSENIVENLFFYVIKTLFAY